MRLVAVRARLVAGRRRRLFLLVAAAASAGLLAVVGVVAADALGVTLYDAAPFCGMARTAFADRQERAMRQPRVTALAILVAR